MRARTARWVAGCAAAGSVTLTGAGAGAALAYADRHLAAASLTGWTVSDLSGQVVNAAVPVVGLVLAARRPGNRIGWLFLAAGLALGLSGFSGRYALHALVADPGSWPAGWLFNVIWVIPPAVLAFVLLLFPTGHVRSRRWRQAGWFIAGAFTLAAVWALIAATSQWARIPNLRVESVLASFMRQADLCKLNAVAVSGLLIADGLLPGRAPAEPRQGRRGPVAATGSASRRGGDRRIQRYGRDSREHKVTLRRHVERGVVECSAVVTLIQ